MASGGAPNVAELAAQLQRALDASLAQNEQLAARTAEAERRAAEAAERAKAADELAAETQRKLAILEALKTKEYQVVVRDLFQAPSRRAAVLTMIVALVSIGIGLGQTIYSLQYSSRSNAQLVAELTDTLYGSKLSPRKATAAGDPLRNVKMLAALWDLSQPALEQLLEIQDGFNLLSSDWQQSDSDAPALIELQRKGFVTVTKDGTELYPYAARLTESGQALYRFTISTLREPAATENTKR